jgi:hypothetical protein
MYDDELTLLMQSLGASVLEGQANPTGAVAMLISETVKFRDKLKEETGETLTVGDTRAALDALEDYLNGKPIPKELTAEQKALVQIWIDRLTVFKK